jgi:hypothetical protein
MCDMRSFRDRQSGPRPDRLQFTYYARRQRIEARPIDRLDRRIVQLGRSSLVDGWASSTNFENRSSASDRLGTLAQPGRGSPLRLLALGGAATKPWRGAERAIIGRPAAANTYSAAADAALAGAVPRTHNRFKIELAKRTLVRASKRTPHRSKRTTRWSRTPRSRSGRTDRLTLYDATQFVYGVTRFVAKTFGIPPERVRVVSKFVGGAFGSKGSAWSHVVLAAMAAKHGPGRQCIGRQSHSARVSHP